MKKHEAAMKEMARRKNENSRKPAKIGISGAAHNKVVLPQRGIAAGVRNKNKHLQEFENLKTSYRKKKGRIRCVCFVFVCVCVYFIYFCGGVLK